MKKRNNIPAFTIMELVIAMLISAIAIGLMYSAYTIVSKSYLSFTGRNEDISTVLLLDQRLNRDISKAEVITRVNNTITMKSGKDTIRYNFAGSLVIRQSLLTDTFKVNTDGVLTSFESMNVDEPPADNQGKVIDDIRFILLFKGQKIPYHYHKAYSSVNLLQSTADAIN